jgi:hypothetical protein
MTTSLTAEVKRVCTELTERVQETTLRGFVERVGQSVGDPLVVAVAGRLKAGKSTLVNALLGRRVAPVAVGECTKVVTWFRYAPRERIEVTPRSGVPWTMPFDADGCVPHDLGRPHTDIERVDVWLSNRLLERMTLVDTPGLDALTPGVSAATEDYLAFDDDSLAAMAGADALVFLLPQLAAADHERLRSFRHLFDGTSLSPVNVVGVLSKADRVGDPGSDPVARARELVARYAVLLNDVVATVVPVIGLLAETSDADRFTESDAEDLRRLAAVPAECRAQLLASAEWFTNLEIDSVPSARRSRLLAQLDLYGVGLVLDAIDSGCSSTSELVELIRATSGIADLRLVVEEHFGRRAEALKAFAALSELERLSYFADRDNDQELGHSIRTQIERVRLDPAMHELAEFDAYRMWWSGAADLPDELGSDLRSLVVETSRPAKLGLPPNASVDECAARALERATRWLAFQNDSRSTPTQVRVAAIARESYTVLWGASASVATS